MDLRGLLGPYLHDEMGAPDLDAEIRDRVRVDGDIADLLDAVPAGQREAKRERLAKVWGRDLDDQLADAIIRAAVVQIEASRLAAMRLVFGDVALQKIMLPVVAHEKGKPVPESFGTFVKQIKAPIFDHFDDQPGLKDKRGRRPVSTEKDHIRARLKSYLRAARINVKVELLDAIEGRDIRERALFVDVELATRLPKLMAECPDPEVKAELEWLAEGDDALVEGRIDRLIRPRKQRAKKKTKPRA